MVEGGQAWSEGRYIGKGGACNRFCLFTNRLQTRIAMETYRRKQTNCIRHASESLQQSHHLWRDGDVAVAVGCLQTCRGRWRVENGR